MQNVYIAIDLKSFYASVECVERGLDPLKTNLVVADSSRTEKTICLAVSPSLKSYGIPGRARLFEVVQKAREINTERRYKAHIKEFREKSYNDDVLKTNKNYELDYIIAPPQMKKYMKYSTEIYNIYLKYFSADDIFVYSIDEVFIDVTHYLNTYNVKANILATNVIHEVYETTGITATCGIGTNLYLAKVAMDVVAKHIMPNEKGVRIAWLNEEKLYKLFGINAELLIDHSWGYEPCTIESIKAYTPATNSLSSGQVLHCPYDYIKTKLIVKEMAETLSLDLVEKGLETHQIVLTIGYDIDNLKNSSIAYTGKITKDRYGRSVPEHAHGTINLDHYNSSTRIIEKAIMDLFDRIVNKNLLCRRINISVNNLISEEKAKEYKQVEQLDLFTDYTEIRKKEEKENKEHNLQKSILSIKQKYGKNAILKGMNFEDGATAIDRNSQVGGHKE